MLLVVTPTGCPRAETGLSPIWEPTPHAPEKKEHAVGGEEGRAMMDAEVKLQFLMGRFVAITEGILCDWVCIQLKHHFGAQFACKIGVG